MESLPTPQSDTPEMLLPAALVEGVPLDDEQRQLLEDMAREIEDERQRILTDLAQAIDKKFTERQARRTQKEGEWLESMRLYLGPLGGMGIRTTADYFGGGPAAARRPEINLVRDKCQLAISEGIAKQFAGGDKNWDLNPPIVPEAGMDRTTVDLAAEAMEQEIHDQLTATKYGYKCRQAYEDRVVLGTGIMKGPVAEIYPELTYEQVVNPETGQIVNVPKYTNRKRPVVFRVDPWMAFPDDTVTNIRDAEDFIELHPMGMNHLRLLKKNPGFFPEAIDKLLKEKPREYINDTLAQYSSITDSGNNIFRDKYAVLEYHGPVTKTQLDTLSIEPTFESPNDTYYGEVWVCQGTVIRVELEQIEGLFELPYAVCVWETDPGSIFGFGNPQILKDMQRTANQAFHMWLDNTSISSRSSVIVNSELVEPMDGSWQIGPGKVWKTTDYAVGDVRTAFAFVDVPNQSANIIPLIEFAIDRAQTESALPQMVAGLESGQTGSDSATGLSILQQNSTIVSDYLAEQWDQDVTERLINRFYHWNQQYGTNPAIFGDFEVDVSTSTELRQRQLAMRDLEKLSVESAQNPEVAAIIKPAELARARIAMMHINSNQIVKSNQEIAAEQEAAAQNPPPDLAMLELQLKEREIGVKEQQLQLDAQRLQFESTKEQQREIMQHDERMSANEARMREAEARVIEVQTQREIEMLKLAQRDDLGRAQIMAQLDANNIQNDTKKFLAGIAAQQKATQLAQTQEELQIKKSQGTGI